MTLVWGGGHHFIYLFIYHSIKRYHLPYADNRLSQYSIGTTSFHKISQNIPRTKQNSIRSLKIPRNNVFQYKLIQMSTTYVAHIQDYYIALVSIMITIM